MYRTLIFICILCVSSEVNAAKILAVFPVPSISHQVVFRPLTQELAKRGHEVVVITADPAFPKAQSPANLTEIDLHDISYTFLRKLMSKKQINYEIGRESGLPTLLKGFLLFYKVMEEQLKYEPVQKLIRQRNHFDLILTEAIMMPALIFSYIFKAPLIQVSSFGATLGNLETVGASTHPTLYPVLYRRRLYNLSLRQKIREYYNHGLIVYYNELYKMMSDQILQGIFGAEIPSTNELNNNVEMLLLNYHPIWMDNQPMPPNVIFMGGLHQKSPKELPQDLESYLDSSKNGVVYVSFGTNIHSFMIPPERLIVLTEALSELPYDVLFKWNDDKLPGRTDNIKISKWLPQSDILRHPKVKAFLMQGGLQSTDEAITAGVPLVCIPMIVDQFYNSEKYVKFNIGLKLDFITFSKSELKNAIETVIANKSYRENIIKLRKRMQDQPQTPLKRAVWWVEYVIRHGGAEHLRTPAANISWPEYLELELVLVALTVFVTITIIFSYAVVALKNIISRCLKRLIKIKRI